MPILWNATISSKGWAFHEMAHSTIGPRRIYSPNDSDWQKGERILKNPPITWPCLGYQITDLDLTIQSIQHLHNLPPNEKAFNYATIKIWFLTQIFRRYWTYGLLWLRKQSGSHQPPHLVTLLLNLPIHTNIGYL